MLEASQHGMIRVRGSEFVWNQGQEHYSSGSGHSSSCFAYSPVYHCSWAPQQEAEGLGLKSNDSGLETWILGLEANTERIQGPFAYGSTERCMLKSPCLLRGVGIFF